MINARDDAQRPHLGQQLPNTTCPITSAHLRLQDVHEYWHQLARDYMDPVAFRRTLNTTIQELRNISFLVQKQKSDLPGFDAWYSEWVEDARADKIMRWVIGARNRIVKEGDLDILSKLTVRLNLDWMASADIEIPLSPRTPRPLVIQAAMERIGKPPFGLVTVERKWVDYSLGNIELLESLGHAYHKCAELVSLAHKAVGVGTCPISTASSSCTEDSTSPECMLNASSWTSVRIDVGSNQIVGLRSLVTRYDRQLSNDAAARYGPTPDVRSQGPITDAIEAVDYYLEAGRRILAVDEDLVHVVAYFRNGAQIDLEAGRMENRNGKVMWADHIASTAIRLGATSVLMSVDSWGAPLTNSPLDATPISERPDRTEELLIFAVAKDGRRKSIELPFARNADGTAVFGDSVENEFGLINIFEPLRRAWGLDEWKAT